MLKRIFFWRYGRTTWQYDVLCVLILAFVFLTPKGWFDNGKPTSAAGHRTEPVRVFVPVDSPSMSKVEVEQRVRTLSGRADAQIESLRPVRDRNNAVIAYEVKLR